MKSSLSAAIFTAALGLTPAVGALVFVSTPAMAQAVLSATQISTLQASLAAAIAAANGDSLAITAAVSQAVKTAILEYGPGAAGSITSAVITSAERAGAPLDLIGIGLAQAAASNAVAADAIATTVANEGKPAEIAAFQTAALSLGYPKLASIAGNGATPTGETGGIAGGGLTAGGAANGLAGGFTGGGAGGGGGGCLNPSCTSL